ncbi:hypothetical protein T8J41_14020 [Nitratireductor rhodophyticola]|uniref:hypothetical protein n=1 Tax=Nitratireductor rhodophyticola TaxID=2854036 RepID=UPI002AC8D133|nr:hypothetical protein [Nitratireductor rhodophyticola]WPZ13273.1 hypothetical protein T8J41_14020 [Nitratireductor rhodophyticola]
MAGNLYEQGYYETGTASVTQGQTVVTGQGTAWLQIVRPADDFGKHVGMPVPIASVDSDTQITLAYPWPGPTQTAEPYRITFTPYHVAYRQALQEIGQLLSSGNVSALAGLVGAANKLPMFTGAGALELIAKQDLINGVRFDVQVADLAGRAAYDNEAAGFTVLVADVGDGRSAIYTKNSVAAADWSAPAYITGPTGATGSPWEDWQGAWATATAYDKLAGVENNGSSYICTTAHTSDAASEPGVGASWQTYWDLVAAKGADGLGTGDVVGPASATDNNVVFFDGTTGKLIKDGGALGSAAFAASGDFATAAQGAKADAAFPKTDAGALTGLRNCLINPLFEWNQRSVSGTVTLAAGEYGHDRWKAGASGCTYTFSTTAGITTITISSGSLQQVVESGCFAGRSGDYYLSWSGTAQGRINGGGYGASGAVSAALSGAANATVEFNTGTLLLPQLQFDYESEFGTRHPQQELGICQRYFRHLDAVASKGAYNDASVRQYLSENQCNPPMRSAPTFSSSSDMVYTGAGSRDAVTSANLGVVLTSPHSSKTISGSTAVISWAYTGTGNIYGAISLDVKLDAEL